jgi:sugar/nucleoside kinase (ribokinase family)
MKKEFDVVALGNALVDILANVREDFYAEKNAQTPMIRGTFNPADNAMMASLYKDLPHPRQSSGGSVANTVIGVASFGGSTAFFGKTGRDNFGAVFTKDMETNNVTPFIRKDPDGTTGHVIILVTPDGERTMNAHIGVADRIKKTDIRPSVVTAGKILMLEGYQFNNPSAKTAFNYAADLAHAAGRKVAFTLSSERSITEHHADFLALIRGKTDILFSNAGEIKALTETGNFDDAVKLGATLAKTVVITNGKRGAIIAHNGQFTEVEAEKNVTVVDTTGAGDQFAGGYLYGETHGFTKAQSARLGGMAAAEVISHLGPRPQISYATLIKKLG